MHNTWIGCKSKPGHLICMGNKVYFLSVDWFNQLVIKHPIAVQIMLMQSQQVHTRGIHCQ